MPDTPFHIPRRLSPDQTNALFARQRAGDRLGHAIQVFLAVGACFFGAGSTSFTEWAALPVLICFLIRIMGWHSVLEPLAFDRVAHLLLAWGAWIGLSVWWSAGRGPGSHEWLHDVQSLRFLVLPIVLWPVMDRRSWMVVALAAGLACGELAQLVHAATITLHLSWAPWHRAPGRISGWWDPAEGGSILCAALGLWLGPAMFAGGVRARWIGAAGAGVTLACIGMTGTRGAWIGAGLLMIAAGAIGLARRDSRRRVLWPCGAALAALVVLGVGGVALMSRSPGPHSGMSARFERGLSEVRGALGPHGYETDTGLRIAMWRWALAAFRTHPVCGVGAGGYQPWVRAQTPETAARLDAPIGAAPMVHAHAHSWYLHTLATLGLVGLGLLLALAGCAIVSGFPRARSSPRSEPRSSEAGRTIAGVLAALTAFGPPLGLIGLACSGLFDATTINQQTAYLFYLLVAFCLPSRPSDSGMARATPVPA